MNRRKVAPDARRRAKRWIDDETAVAVHEAHKRKVTLHGKHRSYGGSEEAKWRGWDDVAKEVNAGFNNERDGKQCYDKVRCFASDVKLRYLDLKDEYGKSGAGGREITRDDFTEVEWLALDYLGLASIEGIENIDPVPLYRRSDAGLRESLLGGSRYNRPRAIDRQIADYPENTEGKQDKEKKKDDGAPEEPKGGTQEIPTEDNDSQGDNSQTSVDKVNEIASQFLARRRGSDAKNTTNAAADSSTGSSRKPVPAKAPPKPSRRQAPKKGRSATANEIDEAAKANPAIEKILRIVKKSNIRGVRAETALKMITAKLDDAVETLETFRDAIYRITNEDVKVAIAKRDAEGDTEMESPPANETKEPTMLEQILNKLEGILNNMTEQDWEDAMDLSRVRSERFPDYERKAVKVFKMVDEDDEPAILETVQEAIKNKKVDPFHRARLLMVVVAKIVESKNWVFDEDNLENATFPELLQQTAWLDAGKNENTPAKEKEIKSVVPTGPVAGTSTAEDMVVAGSQDEDECATADEDEADMPESDSDEGEGPARKKRALNVSVGSLTKSPKPSPVKANKDSNLPTPKGTQSKKNSTPEKSDKDQEVGVEERREDGKETTAMTAPKGKGPATRGRPRRLGLSRTAKTANKK